LYYLYLAALFYSGNSNSRKGIEKLFDKLTVKPKLPRKGRAAKVQQPDLNTLDPVSLKSLRIICPEQGRRKRGKIGVFFADTFGAYAKVLSLLFENPLIALRGIGLTI
jgi:hypothetical protein